MFNTKNNSGGSINYTPYGFAFFVAGGLNFGLAVSFFITGGVNFTTSTFGGGGGDLRLAVDTGGLDFVTVVVGSFCCAWAATPKHASREKIMRCFFI